MKKTIKKFINFVKRIIRINIEAYKDAYAKAYVKAYNKTRRYY